MNRRRVHSPTGSILPPRPGLAHISRARVTQIMDPLLLAPEIQEEILFLPPMERGKDDVTERHMRRIAAESAWDSQLKA